MADMTEERSLIQAARKMLAVLEAKKDPTDAFSELEVAANIAERALARRTLSQEGELKKMEARKDAAYLERNRVVAALAKCFPAGRTKTNIEGWSPDWHGCVYIDLPTGQVSWHFHDSHAALFDFLPEYAGAWDGHDTDEKYRRLAALSRVTAPERELVEALRMARGWVERAYGRTAGDEESARLLEKDLKQIDKALATASQPVECAYCEGKGKQFEAFTMEVEKCLYCDGTGKRKANQPVAGEDRGCTCCISDWPDYALCPKKYALSACLRSALDSEHAAHLLAADESNRYRDIIMQLRAQSPTVPEVSDAMVEEALRAYIGDGPYEALTGDWAVAQAHQMRAAINAALAVQRDGNTNG